MPQIGTLTAIMTHFAADVQLAAAFPNGLWLDELPEKNVAGVVVDIEVNGPFVAMRDIGNMIEYSSEIAYVEKRSIMFMVFAVGAVATETAANLIRRSFKPLYNKAPALVQWLKFELVSEKLSITAEPTASGKRVFVQQLDYDLERMGDVTDW